MQNCFVHASNGVRYAYRSFGESTETPLLLLAHFRANLDMWDPLLVSEISAKRHVILVDNAGIGLSTGRTPNTIEAMARDVHAFIQARQLTEVDVLGFSLGGYVAQELAISQPTLVRRMVLAGTAPRGTGGDLALSGRVHACATKQAIRPKDLLFLFFAPSPTSREKGIDFIRRLGEHRPDPDRSVEETAWRAQIEAATAWGIPDPGAPTRTARVTQPTLVAHGEFDIMVAAAKGRLLAERIPNATLKIFSDAGHAFLFQEPEGFGSDVLRFLGDELPGRSGDITPDPSRTDIARVGVTLNSAVRSAQCPLRLDVKGTDQHAENARLRAAGRVVRVVLPGGVLAWAIPHHDDLRKLLTDPRVAKGIEHWDAMARGEVPDGWPLIGFVSTNSVINAHGGTHRRLRGLVDQALTPTRVEAMRPQVEDLVVTLLDRLAAQPPNRPVDLRSAFAYPIPTTVISDLLGIPKRSRRMLHVLTGLQTRTDNSPEQVMEIAGRINDLLHDIIEERRGAPRNDLISSLIEASLDGADRLSEEELVGMVLLIFFAGHQSVINVIVNASHALLTHPEQLALVRSGEQPWSAVVEETMRWNGAVNQFPMRYPVEDIEIAGVLIRKGEAILASFGSAGRDPAHHGPHADEFDIRRHQAGHLGFGHGPHFCIGIHLARLQLETALSGFFTRFPEVSLATQGQEGWQPTPVPSFVSNSIEYLPVLLGAGRLARESGSYMRAART